MASCDELSNCLQNLSIKNYSSNKLDDELLDIKSNYEGIFSWDIYEKTGKSRNKSTDILEKVTRKLELSFKNGNIFDLDSMCLRLISCFEVFLNGEFSKALSDTNRLLNILKSTEMDTFFEPISDVCFHIVYSSQAFILAYSNKNIEQVLKSIKPSSSFNRVEKAALCAIKSKIFLEYPPGGDIVALELAESARNFNDTEMYWLSIWLKAKGRKRRYDRKYTLPFRDELEAANKLSTYKNNPHFLLCASSVFQEAGFILKIASNNLNESNKYYKLSFDLMLDVYKIAANNLKLLYECLNLYLDLPKHLLLQYDKNILKDLVNILSLAQNNRIDEILGRYYLKISKDYEKAKIHLVKASSNGIFSSSLQLLKVECILKNVCDFPVVQYLNSLLDIYDCPKRRLIIISQILLYYIFIEKNQEQLLHYLNDYLNEDIDDLQKNHHIVETFPLYMLKTKFQKKNFLHILTQEVQKLKMYQHWNSENKNILKNVISKFDAICNPTRTEANIEINLTCVICMEIDTAYVVLRPCGHQCVCNDCWNTLKLKNPITCPMCRASVISTIILH